MKTKKGHDFKMSNFRRKDGQKTYICKNCDTVFISYVAPPVFVLTLDGLDCSDIQVKNILEE